MRALFVNLSRTQPLTRRLNRARARHNNSTPWIVLNAPERHLHALTLRHHYAAGALLRTEVQSQYVHMDGGVERAWLVRHDWAPDGVVDHALGGAALLLAPLLLLGALASYIAIGTALEHSSSDTPSSVPLATQPVAALSAAASAFVNNVANVDTAQAAAAAAKRDN